MGAGEEIQDCYFFNVPAQANGDLMVDRFELALNPGSHHMNVFRVKTLRAQLAPAQHEGLHRLVVARDVEARRLGVARQAGHPLPGPQLDQLPLGVVAQHACGGAHLRRERKDRRSDLFILGRDRPLRPGSGDDGSGEQRGGGDGQEVACRHGRKDEESEWGEDRGTKDMRGAAAPRKLPCRT